MDRLGLGVGSRELADGQELRLVGGNRQKLEGRELERLAMRLGGELENWGPEQGLDLVTRD
jgi:hypothetical protein